MKVVMFEYAQGWGPIKSQIEDQLNELIENLENAGVSFVIKYFPTGKGIVVVVECKEIKE